ncbi:hypothetical protein GCM10022280_20710 [Sphingomonas swuensis]|uniref:Glycosyltransferase RgtA/B/C/D-like domain-containing protein n=1 Tax=Sphingomonas swuensis TaxID=977800 RepID=A0ABP7T3B1_9SPHN
MGETIKTRWLLLALGLLFLAVALSAPVNHDESQYVAAIALMREGLPYRDWAYLQTPLQPLLLSPLSLLPAGWLLVGARLANVAFALVASWALLRLLKGRTPFWAAAVAVGGMATTNAFLFGTEVARNDMLPVALLSLALLVFMPRQGLDWRRAALGGLCLGLAISAKISLALPAAAIGLWLLWRSREIGWQVIAAAALGGIAGLLPCLILYALAPEPFVFGVFTYSLEAPQQFWTLVGMPQVLTPLVKLRELGIETVEGATLAALLVWLLTLRQGGPERRLLDAAILGGLLAAYLPDPFFRQYLIPLLPPLFARAALSLPALTHRWRQVAIGAGAITAGVGASGSVGNVVLAAQHPLELMETVQRARIVAAMTKGRMVATLSPEQVAGNDVRLDPRFAAGPFLFRTTGNLGQATRRITGAAIWEEAEARTLALPPFVVTGGEGKPRPPAFPYGVEAPLSRQVISRYYKSIRLPGEGWFLWIARTEKGWAEAPPLNCPPENRQPICLKLTYQRE